MKILKNIFNWFLFFMTGKGPVADDGVDAGVLDYSGEGRDAYGK